ncbi:MAG: MarR family transcriptional regulator [Anaerolineae bacterium]|nr:MarR family transcriptional regulator [Anaerolineae bacterium]
MSEIKDIWLHAHNMLRSARQIINENLHPLGLSSAEGNILLHLFTQGHEMGQEQLVAQLDVSKAAISRTLNSLERKGYVTRQRDPDDRRAHRVQLTDAALAIGPAAEQIYNRIFALAVRGISQDELECFINLLSRISENFTGEQVKL